MKFPGAPVRPEDGVRRESQARLRQQGRARRPRMGNVAGYREAWQSAARVPRQPGRTLARRTDRMPSQAPDRDLQLETLAGVLDGEILVQIHCYRADEMAHDDRHREGVRLQDRRRSTTRSRPTRSRDLLVANDICAEHVGRLVGLQDGGLRRHPREHRAASHEAGGCAIIHSDTRRRHPAPEPGGGQGDARPAPQAGIAIAARRRDQVADHQPGEGARHRQA